jgi:3-demethoxyubiquinol 3-hydroxylase
MRSTSPIDGLIAGFDRTLRALSGGAGALLPSAAQATPATAMGDAERRHAAALMRVNHVGEVCAQALYHGQAFTAQTDAVRAHMDRAAAEEGAHLVWTQTRIQELGGRTSLLNPLWYAGAFALGALAGRSGDARSLGFVAETEKQVEQHLDDHLGKLPPEDARSRAVLEAMRADEVRHGQEALGAGGIEPPLPVRVAMKAVSKVMTTTAYYV